MSNEQRVKSYASLKTILKDFILYKIVNSHEFYKITIFIVIITIKPDRLQETEITMKDFV